MPSDSYQARFARRWGRLRHPDVRSLAWLLDAPDLLDPLCWPGRVATLGKAPHDWLFALDADPAPLLAALGGKVYTRLGLYAEKLMAFYFASQGTLVAHGLQVRAARNDTVGEFDFLLDAGDAGVDHIELATKVSLLQGSFVGPNLADSLGAKIGKIMDRQLTLGSHAAAQAVLPRPVARAQALVKGWLFYPPGGERLLTGIAADHCRGFWCEAHELGEGNWQVLPRLQWLAPYRADVFEREDIVAPEASPVLVARLSEEEGGWVETERGFVVPAGWAERARQFAVV